MEFFCDEVNPIVPLFERDSLLSSLQDQYPADTNEWDPARWACLKAIVAIALQMKTLSSAFRAVSGFSWSFFKKAFAVYPKLIEKVQ